MTRLLKIIVCGLAIVGLAYITMLVVVGMVVDESRCKVYPVAVFPSPSGKFYIKQTVEQCDDNTLRSMLWLSDSASLSGRMFSVTGVERSLFEAKSEKIVQPGVVWLNESELQIILPRDFVDGRSSIAIEGIKIVYKEQ